MLKPPNYENYADKVVEGFVDRTGWVPSIEKVFVDMVVFCLEQEDFGELTEEQEEELNDDFEAHYSKYPFAARFDRGMLRAQFAIDMITESIRERVL